MNDSQRERIYSKDDLLAQPRASRDLSLIDGYLRAFGRITIQAYRYEVKMEEATDGSLRELDAC